MTVPQAGLADSTLSAIVKKVRRLTASSSESTLSTNDIYQYINTFYENDFAYAIKLDQMRSVYTFYTRPYIDRYPLNVNYNQGVRGPIYFEGIQGHLFKDRNDFYAMWPRWPIKSQITVGANQVFNFTINYTPCLSKECVIGGTDSFGNPFTIADDGNGNLNLQTPNGIVPQPTGLNPGPGMINNNVSSTHPYPPGGSYLTYPGDLMLANVGTVNYVTGTFNVNLTSVNITPSATEPLTVWVSQYQTGRPYTAMFWNNEFTVRPIPKLVHKVEVECYLTPVQFLSNSQNPVLNQWWQYIALGAAIKVLEDRQDMEGLENLALLFDRQEGLVLERQGVEEINSRNTTIFTSTIQGNNNWGNSQGWY
jgi:hypothetical protein